MLETEVDMTITKEIIVTDKDFFNFIKSQPDDKVIKMTQPTSYIGDCGCLLVQYGKSLHPDRDLGCSFDSINLRKWIEDKKHYAVDISYVLSHKACNLIRVMMAYSYKIDKLTYKDVKEYLSANSL
jgi:hypothetical protein